MELYPWPGTQLKKDNIQWPGTQFKRCQLEQCFTMSQVGLNCACLDRSIVLDITWDYTMAWYPAHKIISYKLVDVIEKSNQIIDRW